jgi:hypothetical protein
MSSRKRYAGRRRRRIEAIEHFEEPGEQVGGGRLQAIVLEVRVQQSGRRAKRRAFETIEGLRKTHEPPSRGEVEDAEGPRYRKPALSRHLPGLSLVQQHDTRLC